MVQSVNRALDVLEYVERKNIEYVQLRDISKELGLNDSTCANLVKTLLLRGYLEKAVGKRGYKTGKKLAQFFGDADTNSITKIIEHSKLIMNELSSQLHEGCILTTLKGSQRIILHEEKTLQELQVVNYKEKSAYDSSTGRVMLGSFSTEQLEAFVKEQGLPEDSAWPEVQDKDELFYELGKIRKRGYAQQTSKAHVTGFAMPIKLSETCLALGVYLPEIRLNDSFKKEILEKMTWATQQIKALSFNEKTTIHLI